MDHPGIWGTWLIGCCSSLTVSGSLLHALLTASRKTNKGKKKKAGLANVIRCQQKYQANVKIWIVDGQKMCLLRDLWAEEDEHVTVPHRFFVFAAKPRLSPSVYLLALVLLWPVMRVRWGRLTFHRRSNNPGWMRYTDVSCIVAIMSRASYGRLDQQEMPLTELPTCIWLWCHC